MEIKNIRVKKSETNPETAEVLASAIIQIAEAFEALLSTKISEDAIVQLLMGMPGMISTVSKSQVKLILRNLKRLKGWYVRP